MEDKIIDPSLEQFKLDLDKAIKVEEKRQKNKEYITKSLLFILTLICTSFAGSEWIAGKNVIFSEDYQWIHFVKGLGFAVLFLGILTAHEFGHYFMAKYHKISVSLPNYIPGWLGFIGYPSIGTFGALIRIREKIKSKKQYFDIGVAGPLAGFLVALFVLFYGFTNLPDSTYLYQVHPEYEQLGPDYAKAYEEEGTINISLGSNLLLLFFEKYVADPDRLPNRYEMFHYPWLFAGYLALFFTALNLLPIGQLDGGHILYGLFGRKNHQLISTSFFVLLATVSGIGIVSVYSPIEELLLYLVLYTGFLFICFKTLAMSNINKITLAAAIVFVQFLISWQFPHVEGFQVYLLFVFLLGRMLGVQHPAAPDESPLSSTRKLIGWISLIIFILCFSPQPFAIELIE